MAVKKLCAACGQPARQTNPDCKTCIKREQRRAKAEGREPYIPFMTTKAMAAPPQYPSPRSPQRVTFTTTRRSPAGSPPAATASTPPEKKEKK